MLRIIEHRSALPNGLIIAIRVRHDAKADPPVFARVGVELFGKIAHPDAFPEPLPVDEAFLQALAYAERAGITIIWIDDPGGYFPPEKRPKINAPGKEAGGGETGKMTSAESRAARNLLGLTQERLADMADLSLSTIQEFELGRPIHSGLIETIHVALESAGVEFVLENGGGSGVRLKKPSQAAQTIPLESLDAVSDE